MKKLTKRYLFFISSVRGLGRIAVRSRFTFAGLTALRGIGASITIRFFFIALRFAAAPASYSGSVLVLNHRLIQRPIRHC